MDNNTTTNNTTISKGSTDITNSSKDIANPNLTATTSPASTTVHQQLTAINNQLRAQLLSSALKSSLLGASCGLGLSFLLFRRKLFPMWLGLGFGLGKVYGEAGGMLTAAHDELLKIKVTDDESK